MKYFVYLLSLTALLSTGFIAADTEQPLLNKAQLGQQLFFDTRLSANRSESCASCHAPQAGFADPRNNAAQGAVSLGDDGHSLGDRNAPTASYAMFSPDFQLTDEGVYKGGQFHDGRAKDLQEQAGGPPTNPIEMGMPSTAALMARLQEMPLYRKNFTALYGADIFAQPDQAYKAMTDSIAAFERTEEFAPFDSKYDRFLRGEYQLSPEEELGRTLFFSQQFTNCNQCHQLKASPRAKGETFSNYEYHNIGVPVNSVARAVNGVSPEYIDRGLLDNPAVSDPAQAGKFKVPTLRNVAVTGPYMHNGVFKDLRTVVLFYNKYNSRSRARQINPETGETWQAPEVDQNISLKELESGPALTDQRIDALVAFMKTLTDKRYEALLN
ncbi:cytochrome c peroxidase [Amphritea sp. 2_MG-2023]|uniref:cytochrome-c peroxidase n=1 Tax=Amphritea TaxID=515417 RepID=UPI001C06E682|nr:MULTISPECIES: cytochrome c peroxidase [Amphritea]MBU2965685.1 c-type cytochrome [Amphritea atlantica]MDO6417241.1 cytochrome c peroxidase [Amphritea sp. 2_MG-2023]